MPESYPPVAASTTPGIEGHGIALTCATNQDIVQGNTVTNNDNIGILLDGSYHIRVEANDVSGSEHGIALFGAYSNGILGNRVFDNTGTGIRIERGAPGNPPSVANLIAGNDLVGNALDGWDTSGSDTAPAADAAAQFPNLPADLAVPNRWDSGSAGNRYSDFDEIPEGFIDADADGISEAPHPIPGGLAVDNHPLDAERIATAAAPAAAAAPVRVAALGCGGCSIELPLPQGACPVN
jgi:parallel beta-helix repeat protein